MKTLYLLRHAKSSWDDPGMSDFDRPLNERGRRTAPFMGTLMKERGFRPEAVISSPAKRAEQTAELVTEAAEIGVDMRFDERIYEASPRRLVEVLADVGDAYESVLIVGHNPGMEGLIFLLTNEIQPMPTAALAIIELDVDSWPQTISHSGRLISVIRPKDEMR